MIGPMNEYIERSTETVRLLILLSRPEKIQLLYYWSEGMLAIVAPEGCAISGDAR